MPARHQRPRPARGAEGRGLPPCRPLRFPRSATRLQLAGRRLTMDAKVQAVLDAYHARMPEEETMREGQGPRGQDWRDRSLLAVGPETGRLINIIARRLEAPTMLELGTSYGYSGIWLGDAARASGGRLITMELQQYKSDHA